MKRRELFRRALAGAVGSALPAAAADPHPAPKQFPDGHDASKDLARADWKPVFLDAHQDATLVALADLVIPETTTPGAKRALCNRFIDRLLAAETSEVKRAFLASLSYVDGECIARYRAPFVDLPPESQVEFLKLIAYPHSYVTWGDNRSEFAGHAHFRNLKSWISRAYYSSEAGMRELGWTGNMFHGDFEGCTHPDKSHA
jgi:hypothetical protein